MHRNFCTFSLFSTRGGVVIYRDTLYMHLYLFRATRPACFPHKIQNVNKDLMDPKSSFWAVVDREFSGMEHDDPSKLKAIEAHGMLRCVRKERSNVIGSMKNMILFYQKKVDVLRDVISEEGNAELRNFLPLFCSHYNQNRDRVAELKHRFEPYISYNFAGYNIEQAVPSIDTVNTEDLNVNYASDDDSDSDDSFSGDTSDSSIESESDATEDD